MTFELTPGTTIAISMLVVDEESGTIAEVQLIPEEPLDPGICITKAIAAFAERGIRPLTSDEYRDYCVRVQDRAQAQRTAEAASAVSAQRKLDPKMLDDMIAAHRGRPGGDA